MAKSKIDKQILVTLCLNEQEARYLQCLLQNYLGDHGETSTDNESRLAIFDSLEGLDR